MKAYDTNILVYAHRADLPFHQRAFDLLRDSAEGTATWAIPWPCVHEFYSIVTNRRIFKDAASQPEEAIAQITAWLGAPGLKLLSETDDYAPTLTRILAGASVKGPLVHDARILALCEVHDVDVLVSSDRDFSRIPATIRIENPFGPVP